MIRPTPSFLLRSIPSDTPPLALPVSQSLSKRRPRCVSRYPQIHDEPSDRSADAGKIKWIKRLLFHALQSVHTRWGVAKFSAPSVFLTLLAFSTFFIKEKHFLAISKQPASYRCKNDMITICIIAYISLKQALRMYSF